MHPGRKELGSGRLNAIDSCRRTARETRGGRTIGAGEALRHRQRVE